MQSLKSSKSARVYTKKQASEPVNFVVDQGDIFWNTFFDIILEWAPVLRQIYAIQNEEEP